MYLTAETYVSGHDFRSPKEQDAFKTIVETIGITPSEDSPFITIKVDVGYWRKANAIHNWFVTYVQDGVDRCQESAVTKEQLGELLEICNALLAEKNTKKAMKKLPPQSGFFFGSTDMDEGYWQDIEQTIEILTRVIADDKLDILYYRASW
jgi:hypothetical protein